MQTRSRWSLLCIPLVVVSGLMAATCRDAAPVAPSNPPTPVSRVEVGVLGGAPARVQPQQRLQLWAVATDTNGASIDVTNLAAWSSSNDAVVTVAPGGTLSGVSEGIATVTARYQTLPGAVEMTVVTIPCAGSTVTPGAMIFSARGTQACSDDSGTYGQRLSVAAARQTCRWTATVDAPWLGIDCYYMRSSYTPSASGSGVVWYGARPNNTPAPRTGHVTIAFDDGTTIVHTVTEEQPACVLAVNPATSSVPRSGGTAGFELTVTPNDCRWMIIPNAYNPPFFPVRVTPASGIGSQRIEYEVVGTGPSSAPRTWTLEIRDPSEPTLYIVHQITQANR